MSETTYKTDEQIEEEIFGNKKKEEKKYVAR